MPLAADRRRTTPVTVIADAITAANSNQGVHVAAPARGDRMSFSGAATTRRQGVPSIGTLTNHPHCSPIGYLPRSPLGRPALKPDSHRAALSGSCPSGYCSKRFRGYRREDKPHRWRSATGRPDTRLAASNRPRGPRSIPACRSGCRTAPRRAVTAIASAADGTTF